jgi:sodium-dependent dicarboxylate transporter 2/3/5
MATATAWVSRSYLIQPFFPAIDDTVIAISGAILLFMIPGEDNVGSLLKWSDAAKLPWGILLLFGGGVALAVGFDESGLAIWLGEQLSSLQGMSILALLAILILSVNFLTEITSNLATTSVILPILAPLAITVDMHPFALMIATAMAASCAFMLPVATPPNAIVFGSGYFKISDMIRVGVWLNLISVIILFLVIYFFLPILWDLDISTFPADLLKI